MTFKLGETHRTKSQPPKAPRRVKEIEVRSWSRHRDLATDAIASFEQWPIEAFTVESDDHGMFRDSFSQRAQQRALLAVLAHEELLDFKAATFPPCNPDEKDIRAAAARKAGGFCVEKKPLVGIRDLVRRLW